MANQIIGDNGSNNIIGDDNDNDIYGLLANDTIRAYKGVDTLYGDSAPDDVQILTPNVDASYSITDNTFLTVSLADFSFSTSEPLSLGYVILDASGNVITTSIMSDYANNANRVSAIDINVAGGASLVFFTIPASERPGFEWRPFDINTVDIVSTSEASITVYEMPTDTTMHGNDSLYGYEGDDTLFGEGGDDHLVGGAGHDLLSGGDGADVLLAGDDDDTLDGGNGDDELYGQNGNDVLDGGSGNDYMLGGTGDDILIGENGDDFIRGQVGNDLIAGGAGNDELWGDEGDDRMQGDQGNDYLSGGIGEDLIFGGIGADEIHGGDDNDDLRGGAGDDILYGDAGNDILRGQGGNDYLDGGAGDDELYGNVGSNTLLGGEGNDYLFAGWSSADNFLDGQGGADILRGGTNTDTLIFDRDDFLGQVRTLGNGTEVNQHIYAASTGFDILRVNGENHVDFTGAEYQSDPGITGNVISGVESVIGDQDNQTVTVNLHEIDAQSDVVDGAEWKGFIAWLGDGDDTLNFTGVHWQYDAGATSNADISALMIEKMALTNTQVAELQAYVFNDIHSSTQITIWTDADQITYMGTDIV